MAESFSPVRATCAARGAFEPSAGGLCETGRGCRKWNWRSALRQLTGAASEKTRPIFVAAPDGRKQPGPDSAYMAKAQRAAPLRARYLTPVAGIDATRVSLATG